jgi:AcrR family transcriptional regulator
VPETTEDVSADAEITADWHQRVVQRSLRAATKRSIDRGSSLIRAAAKLLEKSNGDGFTVQDVADEAGQSLRTLYQYFESKDDLLLAVFEETQRTYAGMIRTAIEDLTDPLDRLAGALLAAVRMPEFVGTGVDRGLSRLSVKLSEVEPSLVARSREPVTALIRELVAAAAEHVRLAADDPGVATYMLMALKSTFITSRTLGSTFGVPLPEPTALVAFCLAGLGAPVDETWLHGIDRKLRMPKRARQRPSG